MFDEKKTEIKNLVSWSLKSTLNSRNLKSTPPTFLVFFQGVIVNYKRKRIPLLLGVLQYHLNENRLTSMKPEHSFVRMDMELSAKDN
jgi:hypothetical protein